MATPESIIYRSTPPALWTLYTRALSSKGTPKGQDVEIPELQAELVGVSTCNDDLKRYQQVCGFTGKSAVPVTWPHILAFPLHLKLLTHKAFPLPLLGLVHLRNTITQHRPIATGEALDIRVRLGGQTRTDKGIEFDLITEARAAGRLVWEENSTNLFRQSGGGSGSGRKSPPELPQYDNTLDVKAPANLGRQYGRVSGDLNPIHIHPLTARAFGFPRAIAHGMWSKAHCIALLEQQEGWNPNGVTITCQFKKPFFLPGTARLNWQPAKSGWDYQLLNAKGDAPHLSGRVTWEK